MTPTTTGPRPATQGTVRRGDLAAVWTSASATVVAEVDLDVEHPAPPPRRRPLVAGAVVAAVVGLVAASALRSAVTDPPAPTAPAVTAWAQVRSVGTTGGPDGGTAGGTPDDVVVVMLTVANRGTTDRLVTTVDVSGARSAGAATAVPARRDTGPGAEQDRALPGTVLQPLPLTVPAGSTAVAALRLPLRCSGTAGTNGTGTDPGLDLRVRLADATAPVAVVPVGVLADADGACAALRATRPTGADTPVTVRRSTFTATSVRLVVEGLPATARVVAVRADGVPVPLSDATGDAAGTGDAARTIVLAAPAPGCTAGALGVVPTGLQLEVEDGGSRSTRYAAVGPALARWLLTTRCPAAQEVRG